MTTILQDNREIISVQSSLIDSPEWAVGKYGVTKIEAYGEPGMYCDIPWVRVFKDDDVAHRVCCHELASINYKTGGQ